MDLHLDFGEKEDDEIPDEREIDRLFYRPDLELDQEEIAELPGKDPDIGDVDEDDVYESPTDELEESDTLDDSHWLRDHFGEDDDNDPP